MPQDENTFSKTRQLGRKLTASELNFLNSEIALAITFLDLADTTEIAETRRRKRASAQTIHDDVIRRMARSVYWTEADFRSIETALLPLTQRLKALR